MGDGKVGAEWVEDYSNRSGWSDSSHSETCVKRFIDEIDGRTQFVWGDDLAWDEDFEKRDKPNVGNAGTALNYVEKCDMVYFKGHGGTAGPSFGRTDKDNGTAHYTEVEWGEKDLKWIVFDACNVLRHYPDPFSGNVDAAVYRGDDKAYFFKGNQYIRHTFGAGMDSGYPKSIAGNWGGWPSSFTTGIDAAVLRDNGKLYFFKGNQYIRHTFGAGMDSGYPKSIAGNWGGWPPSDGDVYSRWGGAFAGLHYILGFNSLSTGEKNQGKVFAEYLNDGYKIRTAWKKACQEIEGSDRRWAYLRAVEAGTDTENDHWISKGHVSADPNNPTDIIYVEGVC